MDKHRDLSSGSLAQHFFQIALPAAIGMVFTTLYNVVDVFYAGLIGTEAQAGIAIAFQSFMTFITIGFGLSAAMTALIGNSIGAKDLSEATETATQGFGFSIAASSLLVLLAICFGPLLIELISSEGPYRDAGTAYFMVLILGLPAFIMSYGLNGILQAKGDTKSMQFALMVSFFSNIGLNPLLMFGIPNLWSGMGLDGIAMATVICQFGVLTYILLKVQRSDIKIELKLTSIFPKLPYYKKILLQLVPTTFTMLVMFLVGFIVQFFLKTFGTAPVAAYGVALRVEQLFLLPVFGLTGALLPIAAQNYGAGQHDRVREALFTCWKFGWMFMIIACPLLYYFAPSLMRIFTSDPEVIKVGISYLRVDGFILPIYMMLFSINSFLQALKRPIWTLAIGIYRQGFGVAFFSYIFVYEWGFGVVGVWYGIATSVTTGLILSLFITNFVSKPIIGDLFLFKLRN